MFTPMTKLITTALAVVCMAPVARAADGPEKMLVAMSTAGTVECYDPATGRHEGTVIRGLSRPMGLALGKGNDLFVTEAQTGRSGSVKRYDLETGRFVDDFLPPLKADATGAFEQGASLVFDGGDLFVASYHDGRVLRFDGKTGAFIDVAAKVEAGALIQFAIHGGVLYVADFKGHAVQRMDLKTGRALGSIPAPRGVFGVALDGRERLFFSPDINEVHRWEGTKSSIIADLSDGAFVANYLSAGPDGNIYISTAHRAG